MELRVCPDCQKAFYTSPDGESVLCPHCGFVLFERRSSDRVRRELDFFLKNERGLTIGARLEDYSASGVKVQYRGGEVEPDTVVDVDIDELDIHAKAKAVWTKRISSSVYESGFHLL